MADDHSRDELALLRARVEQLETERRPRPRRRLPRRFLPLALAVLLVALIPLATLAASPFNDLTGGVHDANIGLIYDAGITKGCVPNVSYCPTDNVTRQEMASFLARTAGLGANPPVVNAKTAQTATNATNAQNAQNAVNATTATNAQNAGNANTVGGYAPNGLVRVARGQGAIYPATVPLSGTYVSLGAVTITAPGAGFVLVTGSATLRNLTATRHLSQVRLRQSDGSQTSPLQYGEIGANAGTQDLSPTTQTWIFSVASGGTVTYQLQASAVAGDDAFNAALTAIFVPFGSGGASTLGVPDPTTTDGGDPSHP